MEEKKPNQKTTYCLTPTFRAAFAHVFKAHTGFEGQEAKFSITMLFDKKTDITALKKAAFSAATEKWGPKEKWPKGLRFPFRDGNEKAEYAGYAGTIFVAASTKQRPAVIDRDKSVITEEDDLFYSGVYARASLVAYAYDKAGNRGVSFSLQNVQKVKDGDKFSGKKDAQQEFDAIEDDSENPASYAEATADDAMGF